MPLSQGRRQQFLDVVVQVVLTTPFPGSPAHPALKIEPALSRKVQSEVTSDKIAEPQKLRV
jgi:hypothetical protein